VNPAPSRPVLIALSVAAGIKALLSVAVVTELVGAQVAGVVLAALLALDVGVAFYLQGRVVPAEDVVVYERAGRLRNGEAAAGHTGSLVVGSDVRTVDQVAGVEPFA
jgi:hypothetical protein